MGIFCDSRVKSCPVREVRETFRESSSWELEHSRDVENGLPPCLNVCVPYSVCVCHIGTRSVSVGKREG